MDEQPSFIKELPLFPLPTVLFPGGLLPLRIFEVRYLDRIKRCYTAKTPFGVVASMSSSWDEVPQSSYKDSRRGGNDDEDGMEGFAPESFHPIGTLAYITHLERPQPGVLAIRCAGHQRFQMDACEQRRFGLWVADVALMDSDPRIPVPADLVSSSETLQQLVRSMEQQLPNISQMPLALPYHWNDCGWLSNRWCELLPVATVEKQRLMSLNNPLVRLELVSDILDQMGLSHSTQSPF